MPVWLLAVALVLVAFRYWTSKDDQGPLQVHAAEQLANGSVTRDGKLSHLNLETSN